LRAALARSLTLPMIYKDAADVASSRAGFVEAEPRQKVRRFALRATQG
jgi:hypothetical protein